jgi:hypothetical protein
MRKSRKLKCAVEVRNAYQILAGKPKGKNEFTWEM